jgi:hypothetical protein
MLTRSLVLLVCQFRHFRMSVTVRDRFYIVSEIHKNSKYFFVFFQFIIFSIYYGGSKMETLFWVSQMILDILVIIYIVNEKAVLRFYQTALSFTPTPIVSLTIYQTIFSEMQMFCQ